MQDSFDGSDIILLQPGDSGLPFRFKFKPCTASTKNDGSIPYGSTVKGCTWARLYPVIKQSSTTYSTQAISLVSRSSNKITVVMQWSSVLTKNEQYKLSMRIKISNSDASTSHRQFDFARVYSKDR